MSKKDMDQVGSKLKQITTELREYFETRIDLMVLDISESVTRWLGIHIQKLIGYTILGVGLVFASIALAIYLGELLGHPAIGYAIIALPLLLIGLFFAFSKPKGIARNIQNQFMAEILEALDDGEESSLKLPESSKTTTEKTPTKL